jgi:tRNA A-37 threonylcarbamoyl transferase component Bud32
MLVDTPTIAIPDFFHTVTSALSQKYELVAEIGQGGNATVYQAIQKNLDRKVALKVLLPHLVNDQDYLERFHLEARAIAKLRHAHIVTIYDEGCENGVHFMAMEFLDGKDLHHLVRERGRMGVNDAVSMVRCIASALDYAHSYGIVHRDVKSSNIIMTNARTAVLTDFGIAQANYASMHTRIGSVLGTPEFMSPEQAAGKKVDSRSDIYSLGVVLYHTLTGKYPFTATTPLNTIHKIVFENPVPIGKLVILPPAVEHAIDRCLEKDPEKRVANGKELIDLLSVKSAPTSVRISATPKPRVTRLRRPVISIAFAATALFALTAGYFVMQRSAVADVPAQGAGDVRTTESALQAVPSVVGRTEEEAMNILKSNGFQVGRIGVVAVPAREASWKVESQRPAQGTTAKPGSAVHLLIAATPSGGQTIVRPRQMSFGARGGITVSYKPIDVDPFDGFTPPVSIGILEFTGPGGKQTELSAKLYEALRAANQSLRVFPTTTLKAEQNGLGLGSLDASSKQVLNAIGNELSVDFVVTGVTNGESDSSFTLQLIRCAGGITVFSEEFKTTSTSRALDDAVLFLLNRQVPVYAKR